MSVKILSITLLLLSSCCHSAAPGPKLACCVDVTKNNMSPEVVGKTYHEQAARPPCVKAIIFNTEYGQLCADPDAQWVKDLIGKMIGLSPIKAPVHDETLHLYCHTRICPYPQSNPSGTHGRRSKPPCCVDVTKNDMSADVVGETYREQAARQHCVKAIIFNTKDRKLLCADPDAQWVKDLTAKMKKV